MSHVIRVCAVIVWAELCAAGILAVPWLALAGRPALAWVVLVALAVWMVGGIVVVALDRRRDPWTALAQERKKFALKRASETSGIRLKHLLYVEDEQAQSGHVIDKRTGQPVLAGRGAAS
ncbi:hypothetical protein AB0L65_33275 [Nonomuraea sp. NPDC052116]|uniref:hypothetical protein n=1 Tax=Nonomuraea sp. NPDC052116 TaxID=3155665 RepID=UPI003441287E